MKFHDNNIHNKDVVISSRIRLARNLTNYPFSARLSEEQASDLVKEVNKQAETLGSKLSKSINSCTLSEITDNDKTAMIERHIISPQLVSKKQITGLLVSEDERLSVMVNEEDHLRIQSIRSGMDIDIASLMANEVDDILSQELDYAYHDKYGYLTCCPTNLGTGIRASYMLFLPALAFSRGINKIAEELGKFGITLRGTYGEGTKTIGNLYQISNQKTLGRTEEEIIEGLNNVVNQVVAQERNQREYLIRKNFHEIEDHIYRTYGILKYARQLSSHDALALLAQLKFGTDTNLIIFEKECNIYDLMVAVQPGNLQDHAKEEFTSLARGNYRAEYIRKNLPELVQK